MDTTESIIDLLKEGTENKKAPEGLCPNCWGYQEYGSKIRTMVVDMQVDVNNHQAAYAFIQKFVVTHLDGITLKNTRDGLVCDDCSKRKG